MKKRVPNDRSEQEGNRAIQKQLSSQSADQDSDPKKKEVEPELLEAYEEIKERLQFEQLLSDLSAKFIALPSEKVDSAITEGLKRLVEFLDLDRGTLNQFSEDLSYMSPTHFYVAPGVKPITKNIFVGQLSFLTGKLRGGEIFYFSSVEDLPETAKAEKEFCRQLGTRSLISIPLSVGGTILGTIALSILREERSWSPELVSRLRLVGEIFANALMRARTDDKLHRSEARLTEAQRIAHLGNWDWNIITNELHWSDEIYRIFGLTPREFGATYDAFLESVHPDDRQAVKQAVNKVLADPDADYSIEHRVVRPDGFVRIVYELGEVTFDGKDQAIRMVGTVHDITDLKQAENDLLDAISEIEQLRRQLQADCTYLREEIKLEHNFEEIIGESDALKYVLYKVEQIAPTDTTILILGETGTGKELIARAIHNSSLRKDRPLIKVNCATLPSNLIESELFGHEKGAFTGALTRQIGRFEIAGGATIFLDEIGEISLELQPKLLRVLQDGEFERLGNYQTIRTDVRIVAATNRDLEEETRAGRFRKDLWYRLNIFPITMPPLRHRKEDIPLLVHWFINRLNKKMGKDIKTIPTRTMNLLENYSWPGNVRELENVIERSMINSRGRTLQLADKLATPLSANPGKSRRKCLAEVERDYIVQVMEETQWKIEGPYGAARILDLNPSTLRTRMKKLGIQKPWKGAQSV